MEKMYQQTINNLKQEIEGLKQQQSVSTGSATDSERRFRQVSNQLRNKEVEANRQIAELKEQLEDETRQNLRINRRLLLITREYEIQQDALTELQKIVEKVWFVNGFAVRISSYTFLSNSLLERVTKLTLPVLRKQRKRSKVY